MYKRNLSAFILGEGSSPFQMKWSILSCFKKAFLKQKVAQSAATTFNEAEVISSNLFSCADMSKKKKKEAFLSNKNKMTKLPPPPKKKKLTGFSPLFLGLSVSHFT